MKKDKPSCALALAAILLMVPSIIWKGYVLTVLWGWFACPLFDLPKLHLAPAVGVALMASFLTHQYVDCQPKDEEPGEKLAGLLVLSFLWPLMALAIGWIAHLFM